MIVHPGGKVALELCDTTSLDLKVTPPKTGVTVNERPFGKWQTLLRIVPVLLRRILQSGLERRLNGGSLSAFFFLLPCEIAPHLRGEECRFTAKDLHSVGQGQFTESESERRDDDCVVLR